MSDESVSVSVEELRVVIVDDHAMFRAGVRHEIGARCTVVGEGEDVDTAVAAVLARPSPTWSSSTCTCRAAAASR